MNPRATDGANEQSGIIYNANNKAFGSESDVKQAVIESLNQDVTSIYKCTWEHTIGIQAYRSTDCPKTIVDVLRTRYGSWTSSEKL